MRQVLAGEHWAAGLTALGTVVTAVALIWTIFVFFRSQNRRDLAEQSRLMERARLVRLKVTTWGGKEFEPVGLFGCSVTNHADQPLFNVVLLLLGQEVDLDTLKAGANLDPVNVQGFDPVPWPADTPCPFPSATLRYTFPDGTRWQRVDDGEPHLIV
jgi:hypothetical protein